MAFGKFIVGFVSVFIVAFILAVTLFLIDSKTLSLSEEANVEMESLKAAVTNINGLIAELNLATSSANTIDQLPQAQEMLRNQAATVREASRNMKSPEVAEVMVLAGEVAQQEADYFDHKAETIVEAARKKMATARKLHLKLDIVSLSVDAKNNPSFLNRFETWFQIRFLKMADLLYEFVTKD